MDLVKLLNSRLWSTDLIKTVKAKRFLSIFIGKFSFHLFLYLLSASAFAL